MTIDAPDRSVCAFTGEIADGLSFPALLPAAREVEQLRQDRAHLAAQIETWHDENGRLRRVLEASDAALWCVREQRDEALTRVQELEAEIRELTQRLADAETARDTANVRTSL